MITTVKTIFTKFFGHTANPVEEAEAKGYRNGFKDAMKTQEGLSKIWKSKTLNMALLLVGFSWSIKLGLIDGKALDTLIELVKAIHG